MSVHYADERLLLLLGDAREQVATLDTGSVQTVVTSPPYFGLRDYGEAAQYGAEATVGEYVERLVQLFREVRRALADDGTVWLNLGDSYNNRTRVRASSHQPGVNKRMVDVDSWASTAAGGGVRMSTSELGLKEKDLFGIPWRVAFALQADGWFLRSDIIWHKPNPMPESVTDRPTRSHEYVFLLAKSQRYFYDGEAIKEPGTGRASGNGFVRPASISRGGPGQSKQWEGSDRVNRRSVWTVPTVPFAAAHFATYPPALVRPCIRAGSRLGDLVLDPFSGSGTTGMVALQEGRRYVGVDLSAEYLDLSLRERFEEQPLDIFGGLS